MREPDKEIGDLANAVIGAAIEVHRVLKSRTYAGRGIRHAHSLLGLLAILTPPPLF